MKLVQWNPFRKLENSLSSRSYDGDFFPTTWLPPVDIKETKDSYIINAELPGVAKDAINVDVKEDILSISAQHNSEKEDDTSFQIAERCTGKLQRHFSLPQNVLTERIEAGYRDSILKLTLPKREEKGERTKKIKVR